MEEDGNTLLLEDMRKNSIWFKANDKNKTEIKSISIDLDSCSYLSKKKITTHIVSSYLIAIYSITAIGSIAISLAIAFTISRFSGRTSTRPLA